MPKELLFWDAKEMYFKRAYAMDPDAQRKAHLLLLETLLNQAFESGYAAAHSPTPTEDAFLRALAQKYVDNGKIVK